MANWLVRRTFANVLGAAIARHMDWHHAIIRGAGALLVLGTAIIPAAAETRLHFAANGNFDPSGAYAPGRIGFNLADVTDVATLDALPAGVKGLAWVGRCGGVDAGFLEVVRPYLGHKKLFGLNLMDDPDPTGRNTSACAADKLKAEADWIHANMPGAKTFIALMNLGSSRKPSFAGSYNPANSHVDLFGVSPYPCRSELRGCDFDMIGRFVAAAEAAQIPKDAIVPVFQSFGGGLWRDDGGGRYRLPTNAEEQQIIARWDALVPNPAFDYVYSWGRQRDDNALQASPGLQAVFLHRNTSN